LICSEFDVELAVDQLISLKNFTEAAPFVRCFFCGGFAEREKIVVVCKEEEVLRYRV
jgi:hypothetical protein